jgi:hypothetical protein
MFSQLRRTRLKQLSTIALSLEELLMLTKLGAARDQSCTAWRLVTIEMAAEDAAFSLSAFG